MLQLESVHKQFSTKVLLEGATAHLRPGARVGLVGPNGAGKTTLATGLIGALRRAGEYAISKPSRAASESATLIGLRKATM